MERSRAGVPRANTVTRQGQDSHRLCEGDPRLIIYADTSALLKLLIREPGTELVQQAAASADAMATSGLTYVEARSALARIRHHGRIDAVQHESKVEGLRRIWATTAVVDPSDSVLEDAATLAERHVLRAYDAVQLASAKALSTQESSTFVCWDSQLRVAAAAEGLQLLPA